MDALPNSHLNDNAEFARPLTPLQRRALQLLREAAATSGSSLTVEQHNYVNPIPGEANQYLRVEWVGIASIWLYDDEIGFEDFTFERMDCPSDDEQCAAMLQELEDRKAAQRIASS